MSYYAGIDLGGTKSAACIADGFLKSIGISCGGPLDSAKGIILSPPNLPAWDHIHVCKWFSEQFSVPVYLEMMQMPVPWQNGGLVQE